MELRQKILVVNDEPSIRKYLRVLFEADGCDVEAVSGGKEAISKIDNGDRPDFIILDLLMPEMNWLPSLCLCGHRASERRRNRRSPNRTSLSSPKALA
jgi:CheY-like chemotaxis protein